MDNDSGNLFDLIPENMTQEVCTELVRGDSVKIERIISKGHASPESGWYDQNENEWVVVVKGEATILFENNNEVHLRPGGYLNIPAHKKHKVTWTNPNVETIWIAVHYK